MKVNREAQRRYKLQYDKTARTSKFRVGDWVMIYFLQDETGKCHENSLILGMGHIKLSQKMIQPSQ